MSTIIYKDPLFEGTPKQQLIQLVDWTQYLLLKIVRGEFIIREWPLIPEELKSTMLLAWEELEPQFSAVKDKVNELSDDKLAEYGLTGNQLEFKLLTLKLLWRKLWRKQRGDRFRWRAQRIFRAFLDSIDTILGSLVSAIGVGEAITEFKDTIRAHIEP